VREEEPKLIPTELISIPLRTKPWMPDGLIALVHLHYKYRYFKLILERKNIENEKLKMNNEK
jgi:hypothetical protein